MIALQNSYLTKMILAPGRLQIFINYGEWIISTIVIYLMKRSRNNILQMAIFKIGLSQPGLGSGVVISIFIVHVLDELPGGIYSFNYWC